MLTATTIRPPQPSHLADSQKRGSTYVIAVQTVPPAPFTPLHQTWVSLDNDSSYPGRGGTDGINLLRSTCACPNLMMTYYL